MKRLFTIVILLNCMIVCFAQKKTYTYEMSLQERETGFYYIKYSKYVKSDSSFLTISIKGLNNTTLHRKVQFIRYDDTTTVSTDSNGLVRISIDSLRKPLCIRVTSPGTKYSDFYACIHFWDWNTEQYPSDLIVTLGEHYPSIIHIKSDKLLNLQDFQSIKNMILGKEYDHDIINHIEIERAIYF
ncbi:MAG: hypothetical protein J5848_00225 [Bacteroidales bacterium]|nr:hypothetical protein [Bacteroidales bacterium]